MFYSIIIPIYNRPNELDKLLDSLTKQSFNEFEIIVVEDGSTLKSDEVVKKYTSALNVLYYYKENSGPGDSRNFGMSLAKGDYYILFDSDCIIPETYFEVLDDYLAKHKVDAFGGPDAAHESFTNIQKAINYSMTSFITTGGIRGKKKSMDTFIPRSFNMGVSKQVFETVGGFSKMRFGEDIDYSLRIKNKGFSLSLIPDAFVYHERRVNFKLFFKQIFNSGIARINLFLKHPKSLKIVHLFPSIFVIGLVASILLSIFISWFFILPFLLLSIFIFIDATIKSKNIVVGFYAIIASYVQTTAYGIGFFVAFIKQIILKKKAFSVFEKNFYD